MSVGNTRTCKTQSYLIGSYHTERSNKGKIMDEDNFACAIDGDALQLDICEDGENVIVNIGYADGNNGLGIALTADDANALADRLRMYAAGL